MEKMSAAQAVELVRSGDRVYVHEASMVPTELLTALADRCGELRNVEIVHLHTDGEAPHLAPNCVGHLRHNAFFVGANARHAVTTGEADFTPVFLSDIPRLIARGPLKIDVALVQVSPPDPHGFCRLGLSVACARAAVDHARIIVAELNPKVPVTLGNSALHISGIDAAVEVDRPLPQSESAPFNEVERTIGHNVAKLVPNGATVQVGIGKIPDAVLAAMKGHQDLGVHTEMFGDGMLDLVDAGAITNRKKSRFAGRIVTSFAAGTKGLHRFVDRNPFVEFHPSSVVNDVNEIGKQHMMVSINSAIELDITGQVCADSIGDRVISGIGGQMDFVQGALRSRGGKAIIALPATAQGGTVSRIAAHLKPGAGVVTTRGHVEWVVTEYGAVDLRGRSLRQRAEALITIAHPDHRHELKAAAVARKFFV